VCILVIGYGNTLRGDDGAGVALAGRLVDCWRRQGVAAQLLTVMQLTPELAVDIAAGPLTVVVFVDTVAGAARDGVQLRQLNPEVTSPVLGHHFDPATLLLYVRLLAGQIPPAWLVTVPGVVFAHGEGLSEPVLAVLERACVLADELLGKLRSALAATELQLL
jgi:hydrogenase maturation protease